MSTRLLLSVRSAVEAEAALAGGADVIDIKEPSRGPLGMSEPAIIREILARVAGRRQVSAALGELVDPRRRVPHGLDYVKLGLAGAPVDWPKLLARRAEDYRPALFVAVAYADHRRAEAPPPESVFTWALRHGAAGVLLDTAVKDGRHLLTWMNVPTLTRLTAMAQSAGLFVAVAGSLDHDLIEQVLASGPDIVAVRGAACRDGLRDGPVDAQRVRGLTRIIAGRGSQAAVASD
jgi:uncharacterized protein (UPF0264 family)